jgi:hypothetical protein
MRRTYWCVLVVTITSASVLVISNSALLSPKLMPSFSRSTPPFFKSAQLSGSDVLEADEVILIFEESPSTLDGGKYGLSKVLGKLDLHGHIDQTE